MYARAGIAQYVVVNLRDDLVELYEQPAATGEYGSRRERRSADELVLRVGAGSIGLQVAQLLP